MPDLRCKAVKRESEIKCKAYIGRTKEVERPIYEGSQEVEVFDTDVVLQTDGKRVDGNIVAKQGYDPYEYYHHHIYAHTTLPTKNKYLKEDIVLEQGYPLNEESREYTVLDDDVTINTSNSYFPYGDRFNITVHQGYPEYDGDTEKTLLVGDRTFETAGKIVKQNLKAKLGYEVIHGGMEITTEEWVSEGAPGIGSGGSGTGPSTVTYLPKEYTVSDSNISITDPVAYPGGIVMKQGYERFDGDTELWINTRRSSVHEWFVDGYFYDTQYDPDTDEDIEVESFIDDFILSTQNKYFDRDIHVQFPPYSGSKQFTVTDSPIVIPTENKFVNGNITVNQGIPLYTGATSFTIVDSGLTIATNGKRLNSDITVDISALETLAEEISEVVG